MSFPIFHLPAPKPLRLLFVTDLHAGGTVANFIRPDAQGRPIYNGDPWERAEIMVECIQKEIRSEGISAVFCLGDMVSNEANTEDKVDNLSADAAEKYKGSRFSPREQFIIEHNTHHNGRFLSDSRKHPFFRRLVQEYMARISLPTFYLYANHDDMNDAEWEDLLHYGKNYIVHFGDRLTVVCADNFHDPAPSPAHAIYGFGSGMSDISEEFYHFAQAEIRGRKNVLLASHFPEETIMPRLAKLVRENDNVIGSVCGHTHRTTCRSFGGKPCCESGHFNFSSGFQVANQENAAQSVGAWGFRFLEISDRSVESWMVYPEVEYLPTPETNGFFSRGFLPETRHTMGSFGFDRIFLKKRGIFSPQKHTIEDVEHFFRKMVDKSGEIGYNIRYRFQSRGRNGFDGDCESW